MAMTKLSIIVAPDPRLKRRAEPVVRVDREVRRLMDGMLEAMYEANGIGLAAPQVGALKRVLVADVSQPEEPPKPMRMANPEVIWHSEDLASGEEGCLSLPDHYGDVIRPRAVRLRFRDQNDVVQEIEADGLLAKCIQHEIDHLEGVLFVDHLSALKRGIILRKLTKQKKLLATGS